MNVNAQQSNQFLSYQNYHHDQLMHHHQYFDETPQSYNFVPYPSNESYATASPIVDNMHQQENFPVMQANELYEFLPEEIFQLDQPIVKSESQFNSHTVVSSVNTTIDPLQLSYSNNNSSEVSSASQSFLDLSSGQIQTNVKYPMDNFASEINNNGSYEINNDGAHLQPKIHDTGFSYQETRLNCAVESEKFLKRKLESDQKLHQSYHQPLFTKRENSCLLQQQNNYYHPELYAKSNDAYRSMEKYSSNFITNN